MEKVLQYEDYVEIDKLIGITKAVFQMVERCKEKEMMGQSLSVQERKQFQVVLEVEDDFLKRYCQDVQKADALLDYIGKRIEIDLGANVVYDRIIKKVNTILDSMPDFYDEKQDSKVPRFALICLSDFRDLEDSIAEEVYFDDELEEEDDDYYQLLQLIDHILEEPVPESFSSAEYELHIKTQLLAYQDELIQKLEDQFQNIQLYEFQMVKDVFEQQFLLDTVLIYDKILNSPEQYSITLEDRKFLIDRKYLEIFSEPLLEEWFVQEYIYQKPFTRISEKFKIYELSTVFASKRESQKIIYYWEQIVGKKLFRYLTVLSNSASKARLDSVVRYIYQEQLGVLKNYLIKDSYQRVMKEYNKTKM